MMEELLRGRPAVFVALGLGIGIALASMGNITVVLFAVMALALIASILMWRVSVVRMLVLFSAFVMVGQQLITLDVASYQNTTLGKIASMKPTKPIVTGTLEEIDETNSEYLWIFGTDSISVNSQASISITGRVLLRLPKNSNGQVALPSEGSKLRVFSSLEPFRSSTNPHEFASELKLQTTTHTEATGYVRSHFDYYILSTPHRNILSQIEQALQNVHQSLLTLLDSAIQEGNARGFVEAVVLGDRSDMDKETLNDFTTSGVAHILAVSGFNVAIVALVVAQLLRIFGIYWLRTRISITMMMVLLYSAIVGFQPSVVRALLMIELYLLAQLLERKPDPLNIVMSAAAINLLLRPYDLFDVGFQLSYAGVLGMILIAPKIRWLILPESGETLSKHPQWRKIIEAAALSIGASIASYPVIAAHFYRISFIGMVANIPLVPLSAIITALGFLLLPLAAISHWLGQLYGDATAYLSDLLLLLTKLSAQVPSAAHAAAEPSWIFLVLLGLAIIFCLRSPTRERFVGRLSIALSCFFTFWVIGVSFSNSVLAKNEGKLQVLFFDVGQGDCILIHSPSMSGHAGENYFVDFGRIDMEGNANIERTALPFLRAEDITQIDGGFISHMHTDHYGGAPVLLENCSVASLMTSGERVAGRTARLLDTLSEAQHTRLRVLSRGDTLQLGDDLTLYVLYPDRHAPEIKLTAYGENIHSGMLAFRLVYRNTSFLFLGDAERSGEEEMLSEYGNLLHSNVVKVAHHGSLTSSSKDFIAVTNPEYAVISVGEYNHFGHPAPAIVKRWSDNGSQVCRTDVDGAVLLVSDGDRVEQVDWK